MPKYSWASISRSPLILRHLMTVARACMDSGKRPAASPIISSFRTTDPGSTGLARMAGLTH